MAARQRGAKLMVSYGGKFERCPGGGGQERYVGGEHRLIEVSRSATLRDLRNRLAAVSGFSDFFSVRYGFSSEALDALRIVATEDDVRCMLDWVLHRDLRVHLLGKDPAKIPRVRVFLVRTDDLPPLIDFETLVAPALVPQSATPPPSLSAKPPLPPTLSKLIPSTPSLSTADTTPSKPPLPPALSKRIASAPLLSAADPMPSIGPLPPTICRRVASAPSLSATSTDDTASSTTTTSSASVAGSTSVASCNAAAFHAKQRIMASAAPVFLVPIAPPIIFYQPVVPLFIVPVFSCSMVLPLCCI